MDVSKFPHPSFLLHRLSFLLLVPWSSCLLFIEAIMTESHVEVEAYIKLLCEGMRSEQPGGANRLSDTLRLTCTKCNKQRLHSAPPRPILSCASSLQKSSPPDIQFTSAASCVHIIYVPNNRTEVKPRIWPFTSLKEKKNNVTREKQVTENSVAFCELVMSKCNMPDWCLRLRRRQKGSDNLRRVLT